MTKLKDLIIDPEYEAFVTKTSKEENDELDQSIIDHGLLKPITKNSKNIVLDGHRRYRSCQRIGLDDPDTITKDFKTKLEEIIFVGESNLKRRQLTPLQRIALVIKLEPYYQELAKQRMSEGGRGGNAATPLGKTRDILGRKANVSGRTYDKGVKILESASTKQKEITLNGTHTIDKTYKEIKKKEKREKRHEEIKKIQIKLPETVILYNQDFKKNQIQNNSVSLIFTDPPYLKEYLYLYEELAEQAIGVLKDGGSLMCYVGHYAVGKIINMIEKHGLVWSPLQ